MKPYLSVRGLFLNSKDIVDPYLGWWGLNTLIAAMNPATLFSCAEYKRSFGWSRSPSISDLVAFNTSASSTPAIEPLLYHINLIIDIRYRLSVIKATNEDCVFVPDANFISSLLWNSHPYSILVISFICGITSNAHFGGFTPTLACKIRRF